MLRTLSNMICFAMTLKVYMQIAAQLKPNEDMAARLRYGHDTVERARRSSRDCAASTRADLRIVGQ